MPAGRAAGAGRARVTGCAAGAASEVAILAGLRGRPVPRRAGRAAGSPDSATDAASKARQEQNFGD